jgi:hypothetical protein
MTTDNKSQAAPFPWRELAQAICLRVDWHPIAASALDSELLGGVVGSAVRLLGRVLEADHQRHTRTVDPIASVTADDDPMALPLTEAEHDEQQPQDNTIDHDPPAIVVDAAELEAATLLSVQVGATEDQIRAAFRAKVKAAKASYIRATALTTDPTDEESEAAKKLIAAKQLLVERARVVRT